MIRVLIDCTCILPKQSGVGRYATELLRELIATNRKVEYSIILHPTIKPVLAERLPFLQSAEVNILFLSTPGIGMKRELIFFLNKRRLPDYDVFHSMTSNAPLSFATRGIVTLHDLKFVLFPEFFGKVGRFKSSYLNFHFSRLAKNYAKIVTVSEATCKDFTRLYGNLRNNIADVIVPIHSGYNSLINAGVTEYKEKYGIKSEYLFYLGELRPHKNIEGMIEAFLEYKVKYNKEDLVFVIGGNAHQSFRANYSNNPSILFIGFVDEADLAGLYQGSVACFFASYYEGFGFPILEAMALETIVITSTISSMPEVAGGAAILVDPNDNTSMIEGIFKVMTMTPIERRKVLDKGLKNVNRFSWETCANAMIDEYFNVGSGSSLK